MARIIYNVTVKVDPEIETEWLTWMQDVHIPEVLDTGCFTGCAIRKLRFPKDDDGSTYTFQYHCARMADLDRYHNEFAAALQRDHSERYRDRFVAFRTILEDVADLTATG
ncbi:MAG: DUF4286 family protein [Saprospiraceae bacterium]|nr:DUF4286 family protein [Saprospiraceae bacterium]